MSDPDPSGRDGGRAALTYILGATAVSGVVGYAIQALVPALAAKGDYIAFSVFWSATYLAVSGVSGLQQEVARAAHLRGGHGDDDRRWPVLRAAALIAALLGAAVAAASAPLWAPRVFPDNTAALVAALAAGVGGYAFVAVISGSYYGIRDWRAAAGMTVLDTVLRLVAVLGVLALGLGVAWLGWAVALPFALAAALMWAFTGRRVRERVAVDVGLRGLLRNGLSTVGAALASGVLLSGLPLLLGVTAQRLGESTLAALILVVTLTRAPLIVPLMALQSYLVVTFRDDAAHARGRVVRWTLVLLAATGLLALVGAFVGPWIVDVLYGGRYPLDPLVYAVVIASAGLAAVLCLTGPACLAAGRHAVYVAGWATASAVVLAGLAIPGLDLTGILCVLVAAPCAGAAVHGIGVVRAPRVQRED